MVAAACEAVGGVGGVATFACVRGIAVSASVTVHAASATTAPSSTAAGAVRYLPVLRHLFWL